MNAKRANPAQWETVLQEASKTWLLSEIDKELDQAKDEKTLQAILTQEFHRQHQLKKDEAPEQIAQLEKMILLSVIDHQWNDHVDSMNRLREGIYLRSYAQIKPEDAYRQEGFERFTKHDGQHYRSGSADAAAHSEARAAPPVNPEALTLEIISRKKENGRFSIWKFRSVLFYEVLSLS